MMSKPTLDELRTFPSEGRGQTVRSLNLRTRMAIHFGALFAVVLLCVSLVRTFGLPWTADSGSYGMEQSLILKELNLLADLEKERLRLWVEERSHDATEFAERRVVASSVKGLLEAIHTNTGAERSQDEIKSLLLRNKNAKALETTLRGLTASHSGYGKIRIVVPEDMVVVASTDEDDLGTRISDPAISSSVRKSSERASVLVIKSRDNGGSEVVIVSTIPDRSAEERGALPGVLGAVILSVDGEGFLKPFLYRDAEIATSQDIVLVDQDRRLLLSPQFCLQDGERPRPLEYIVETEPATLAVEGKQGVSITRDYRNVPIFAAYRHIQIAPAVAWGLVVKVDRAEVLTPSRQRLLQASVISLLGVLAASVLAALLAGRIARPVHNLSRAAKEVEAGNLDARAEVIGSDEVGDLASTFNSMIERVRHWQRDLEDQVAIRTRELTELNEALLVEISERQRAEEERERLIGELETKNAELERFTYTVSHDLSSPLITIKTFIGFVEQAFKDGTLSDVESDLNRIKKAAEKMGQLLEELLELSRIGRLASPPTRVSMTEVAQEAVELLEGPITSRGVDVHLTPDMPKVFGDRARLLEVFQNLIENALKFTKDQPHPRIDIGVGEIDGAHAFYVRDNGEGIDPAYQKRIFRLFDKLDQNSEGTGIGLAIVKRIIEVHGGRIWVESQGSNEGSTFWFTLADTGTTESKESV